MSRQTPIVDLRSDTVTRPTAEMRQAMAEAPVGDDVYGEDPTTLRLEEMAADILGFEASLFVPSGTMGNQIALAVHTRPGEEVICDSQSHIIHYEMAAMAALSGLLPRVIQAEKVFPTARQTCFSPLTFIWTSIWLIYPAFPSLPASIPDQKGRTVIIFDRLEQ